MQYCVFNEEPEGSFNLIVLNEEYKITKSSALGSGLRELDYIVDLEGRSGNQGALVAG